MTSIILCGGLLIGASSVPGQVPSASTACAAPRAFIAAALGLGDGPVVPPPPAAQENTVTGMPANGDDVNTVIPIARMPITLVARQSPVRDESVTVALWEDRRVTFNLTRKGQAGEPVELCHDVKDLIGRRFDAAYEQESGDGLVVCYEPRKGALLCVTFSGADVRREKELKVPGDLNVAYMGMKARALSDEIVLMVSGITPSNKLQLLSNVWDGRSWRGWETVSDDLEREELGQDRLAPESSQARADAPRETTPPAAAK